MKIAIIGSRGYPYVYSGYETFVQELAERLVRNGVEVTVYCHANLFKERPSQVRGIRLVYLHTIETKTLSQFLHSAQAMVHACRRRYDIILVVNPANGPFGILPKICRIKAAINVDGLEWLRPKWKGLGSKYFYAASWLATKLYDVIINDSYEMQKIYERTFGAASVVIAYGADARHPSGDGRIRKRGLARDGYYLVVGRLIPDNNGDLILREFLKTASAKKLVIVGDVPYNDAYAAAVKKVSDPRIVFTGYVTDQAELDELYTNCFAYLHGHEFGGTNPTLLRALASGCAVIALDTVFSRETLRGRDHGVYFTKEPDSLKNAIEDLEQNIATVRDLRDKARGRIAECYTWEKITAQYMQLFDAMLGKARAIS